MKRPWQSWHRCRSLGCAPPAGQLDSCPSLRFGKPPCLAGPVRGRQDPPQLNRIHPQAMRSELGPAPVLLAESAIDALSARLLTRPRPACADDDWNDLLPQARA